MERCVKFTRSRQSQGFPLQPFNLLSQCPFPWSHSALSAFLAAQQQMCSERTLSRFAMEVPLRGCCLQNTQWTTLRQGSRGAWKASIHLLACVTLQIWVLSLKMEKGVLSLCDQELLSPILDFLEFSIFLLPGRLLSWFGDRRMITMGFVQGDNSTFCLFHIHHIPWFDSWEMGLMREWIYSFGRQSSPGRRLQFIFLPPSLTFCA